MINKIILNLAKDSNSISADKVLSDILRPEYVKAIAEKSKLCINLDGGIGYGFGWLKIIFEGLSKEFGSTQVLETIEFISIEEPYLIDDITKIIEE